MLRSSDTSAENVPLVWRARFVFNLCLRYLLRTLYKVSQP